VSREARSAAAAGSDIIVSVSLTDVLRPGAGGRFPETVDDLHGPERGVIEVPRHLACPGLREFDGTDEAARHSLYGLVLTQGRRNDMARLINPHLLAKDWPVLRESLDLKVRKSCERYLRGLPIAG
jgi:hypothetical protein